MICFRFDDFNRPQSLFIKLFHLKPGGALFLSFLLCLFNTTPLVFAGFFAFCCKMLQTHLEHFMFYTGLSYFSNEPWFLSWANDI